MSNRIFLDSSILVEYRKGTKTALLDRLLQHVGKLELCISETVSSEYLFHLLALFGQKSPLTLKESKSIGKHLKQARPNEMIHGFSWITGTLDLHQRATELMIAHNLLSNDALILALCQLHQIDTIASYDTDYVLPCVQLNMTLLQSEKDFLDWWQQ
ncbi:MAG: PIN domain-containing protein [Bacteroidota bacterium]